MANLSLSLPAPTVTYVCFCCPSNCWSYSWFHHQLKLFYFFTHWLCNMRCLLKHVFCIAACFLHCGCFFRHLLWVFWWRVSTLMVTEVIPWTVLTVRERRKGKPIALWYNAMFTVALHAFKNIVSPDRRGSGGWASSRKAKGQALFTMGHTAGLWARSPVGGMWVATDKCCSHTSMFLFLSFSLPPPLSKNK